MPRRQRARIELHHDAPRASADDLHGIGLRHGLQGHLELLGDAAQREVVYLRRPRLHSAMVTIGTSSISTGFTTQLRTPAGTRSRLDWTLL